MYRIICRIAVSACSTVLLAGAGSAVAWAQAPTVDPGGAAPEPPPQPAPEPAPQQPQEPVIIQVPSGQKLPPGQGRAPQGGGDASGFYYTDDLDVDRGSFDGGQDSGYGPVPPFHVVSRGDTLWDICGFYFNNPWEWPKVWSYNPNITSPHWIYPGDLVRLYPRGMGSEEPEPAAEQDEPDEPDEIQPTPARRYGVKLRQLAFVTQEELDYAATIVGATEEKSLLSLGDSVYLEYKGDPPRVGQRFAIYTATTPVAHPSTGKAIGAYVRILGELEIQSVKKGRAARALITESVDVIERGDKVGPLQRTFRTVEPRRNEVDLQGTIVAMLGNDQLIGQGQIVFIDKGQSDGVKVGNRMYVVRRGDAYDPVMGPGQNVGQDDRRFPARAIGELIVVQTAETASVALMTLALQEIGIGDLVLMRKSR